MAERLIIHDLVKAQASQDPLVQRHIQRYEYACRRLPPFSRVLDVGCSNGYGSMILSRRANVFAFDNCARAIMDAEANFGGPKIEFQTADILDETLWEGLGFHVFDGICCFEVLEHLPSGQEGIMYRLWQAVMMTGLVFVSIPENHPDRKWHKRIFSKDEIETLLFKYFSIERRPVEGEFVGYELRARPKHE